MQKVRAILMVEFETVTSLHDHALTDALKRGIDELKAGIEGSRLKLPREIRRGSARVYVMSKHVEENPDENCESFLKRGNRHRIGTPKK